MSVRTALIADSTTSLSVASSIRKAHSVLFVTAAVIAGAIVPAQAQSVEQFYAGKQGKMVVGGSSGGGYDFFARMVGPYISRHLPGKPTFIPTSMPGAGGIIAANYLYNVAPKDGTEIGIVGRAVSTQTLLNPKSKAPKYDATKFNWLGTPRQETGMLLIHLPSTIKTLEDLRKHELVVSGTSPTAPPAFYPRLMNSLFGTKFKVVTGYKGSQTALLAVERGEVDGHLASSAGAPLRDRIDPWIKSGKARILAQVGVDKDPRNGDAPLVLDLARNKMERRVMEMVLTQQVMAWPFVAPPGVPADRVKALRAAFDAAMKDPAFLAAANKQRVDIEPLGGERLNKIIEDIYASPKELLDRLSSVTAKPKR